MVAHSRNVPLGVRRKLRREVGFVCPVPGCDSPYLTWHHFDPPWREGHNHDPSGMIALCLDHHKRADAGAFTIEQLREMKSHAPDDPIRGVFDWRREQLVVRAGGTTAISCRVILQFGERDAIWLSSDDEGHQLLNLDVWGSDGSLLFSMRDNDWVTVADLDDLDCPPSGKSLVLRATSLGVELSLQFSAAAREDVRQRFHRIGLETAQEGARHLEAVAQRAEQAGAPRQFVETLRRQSDPDAEAAEFVEHVMAAIARETDADEIALCDLTAEFVFPVRIHLTANKLILPGNNTIVGGLMAGNDVGIRVG